MKKTTKQIISVILSVMMLLAYLPTMAFAETSGDYNYLLGDVNNDGEVNAPDARHTMRIAASFEAATEIQKLAADADRNGKITASDGRMILRVAAELYSF